MSESVAPQPLEARVIELESRIAWQEHQLATLGDELLRQQQTIEVLSARLKAFGERLSAGDDDGFRPSAGDEIPPHW